MIAPIISAVRCAAAAGPSLPVSTASSIVCSCTETRGYEGIHGRATASSMISAFSERKGRSEARARLPERREGVRPVERATREGVGLDDPLEKLHRKTRLSRLAKDGEHHPACDARRRSLRAGGDSREAEVLPDVVVMDSERLGESLSLVDPTQAESGRPSAMSWTA